jgi:hypothetical protein
VQEPAGVARQDGQQHGGLTEAVRVGGAAQWIIMGALVTHTEDEISQVSSC